MRFNDFTFTCYPVRPTKTSWQRYYDAIAKKTKTTYEKAWLKQVRSQIKASAYMVEVKHGPTGWSEEYAVTVINRNDLRNKMAAKIREIRETHRELKLEEKEFGGAKYVTTGGVFSETQTINKVAKHPGWNDPLRDKRPAGRIVNYIGVEVEFNSINNGPRTDAIAGKLKELNLGKYVTVTTDPSCGYEVRCLLPEKNFLDPLAKILKAIKDMGFPCDERCGTHVHLDMRNRDIAQVYKNMFYTQTFLRKFLTKTRKKNKYCLRNTKAEYDPKERVRYMGINVQSYKKHKTLEIRMHHGTLDINELGPWIDLLLKIVNFNGAINKRVLTLKQAKGIFNIEEPLTDVLSKRLGTLFKRKLVPTQEASTSGAAQWARINELYRSIYTSPEMVTTNSIPIRQR